MLPILTILETKKRQLDTYLPFPTDLVTNLNSWYKLELTYSSNAIEGNTLSRAETALVIEKGLTVSGKTLQEHLEAVNHAQAFNWVSQQPITTRQEVTEHTILHLHRLILQKIVDDQAGRYRTVPVRIAGSTVIMPNAIKIPELMKDFINWLHTSPNHSLTIAIDAHFKLVSIHPFVDGNGRTARLLMNLLLIQAGYPPAIIEKEQRKEYIQSIEKAQLGGSLVKYHALMYQAINRSLDIYLESLENKSQKLILKDLDALKIGDLAKLANESVPTIRHWTKSGLLTVSSYSKGGYQLYNQTQVSITKKIRELQTKNRFTISEIKKELERLE